MGRVRDYIEIDGQKCWTLFDTGARNTYIIPKVAALLVTSTLKEPFRPGLGGSIQEVKQSALLDASIQGCRISSHAMVIDHLGKDEEGRDIEVLFGALALQQWGIRPIPDEEKLDLSHYSTDFQEFFEANPASRQEEKARALDGTGRHCSNKPAIKCRRPRECAGTLGSCAGVRDKVPAFVTAIVAWRKERQKRTDVVADGRTADNRIVRD